jgi:hypothetical protein
MIGRACSTHVEKRYAYRILLGKLKGKRPLGRPRHTWEDNIKMDLRLDGVVVRRVLLDKVMNLRVP